MKLNGFTRIGFPVVVALLVGDAFAGEIQHNRVGGNSKTTRPFIFARNCSVFKQNGMPVRNIIAYAECKTIGYRNDFTRSDKRVSFCSITYLYV
jgi:hypothetical protein